MTSIKHILLPIDFSDCSLRATEYALAIAARFHCTLHLLHVIEDPVVYLPAFESYPLPSHQHLETYAQDRLENWISPEDSEGLNLELQWMHGKPFIRIVEYARDCQLDLIVIGTHGRGAAAQLIMGSVAEKVVRKSPCPVLTVHPDGHQFVHP